MTPKKLYVFSYTCQSGHYESELIRGFFKSRGWEILEERSFEKKDVPHLYDEACVREADIVIYNTCAYTEKAAEYCCRTIDQLKALMKKEAELILCGCFPKTNPDRLRRTFNGFSFSWGETDKLAAHLSIPAEGMEFEKLPFPEAEEWNVRISTGCLGECAYCADKIAIGRVKSRTIREIIADVREGARRGFGRILLSAHDSGAYGNDIGYDLPRLLEDVLKVEGNFRISMDCINPNHLLRHLDEYIRLFKSEKMLRYLYPPLESGNDRILRMMKRPYKAGDILKALERFRQEIPAIEFGTDLIVGFPTETEEDFRDTLKVITTIPFRILNIFPYSPRPATEAAGFPGQIPEAVKRERCRRAEKTWKKMNRVFRR